jgi:hypothetical protein
MLHGQALHSSPNFNPNVEELSIICLIFYWVFSRSLKFCWFPIIKLNYFKILQLVKLQQIFWTKPLLLNEPIRSSDLCAKAVSNIDSSAPEFQCPSYFWHTVNSLVKFSVFGKYAYVESLQSHMILTMSHWSSGLTCLLPVTRDPGSIPWGNLGETGILLIAMSCYIGDPDVI